MLEKLLIPPGESPVPLAWKQNELLAHLRRCRLLGAIGRLETPRGFPHPWQVSVARFEPPPASTLDPDKTWAVTVAAGTIKDTLPSILYQRTGDPRGWTPPSDYANPQFAIRDPQWVERDAIDDPDEPPVLILRDPPAANGSAAVDFTRIADADRIGVESGAFCGADTWELELWRAHVLLTAAPIRASYFAAELPPPRLAKYRLAVSPKRPTATFGASAGGWIEIATLYLLRDPAAPEDAELLVRQQEFWPLWTAIYQPGAELVNLFDAAADGVPAGVLPPGFTDILRGDLEDTLQGAAIAEFWTV